MKITTEICSDIHEFYLLPDVHTSLSLPLYLPGGMEFVLAICGILFSDSISFNPHSILPFIGVKYALGEVSDLCPS